MACYWFSQDGKSRWVGFVMSLDMRLIEFVGGLDEKDKRKRKIKDGPVLF